MACRSTCCASETSVTECDTTQTVVDKTIISRNRVKDIQSRDALEELSASRSSCCVDATCQEVLDSTSGNAGAQVEQPLTLDKKVGQTAQGEKAFDRESKSGCCTTREAPIFVAANIVKLSERPGSYDEHGSEKTSRDTGLRLYDEDCCDVDMQDASRESKSEGSSCAGDCCAAQQDFVTHPHADGGCDPDAITTCFLRPGARSGCCDSDAKPGTVETKEAMINITPTLSAIEDSTSNKEHVVLSISGMTCTGCETKLKRTLGKLPYLTNLKASLVLSRAEFDIDGMSATSEDVIRHLHRTTEFTCERLSNRGTGIEVHSSGNSAQFVDSKWPNGVIAVDVIDQRTLRIEIDPEVIGVRALLDTTWAESLSLAQPRPDVGLATGSSHVRRMGLMTLLSAILTIPVLIMAWAPLPEHETGYGSASLALATLVQVVIAGPFYPKAIKALVFSRVIEMDLLIVLSTSAAYIFSVVSYCYMMAGMPLATGEFFETSTLLVTLIMVGRWLAAAARQKAAEAVSIRSLQVSTAVLVRDGGEDQEIDARLLQFGDVFKVAPDSRIPTDGTIIAGLSEVDESMLTGESKLVSKCPGTSVVAGSVNGTGELVVRLTRLPSDNTITTIACMVDEAKLSKPKIQDVADKVAGYFVPVVITLTIITFVIWIAIGVAVRDQSGSMASIEAITYAITVLIVSCPCAIGLAVPMVIVVASGVAARKGVVFKCAASIEVAHKTTDVVFDKTGTLTIGQLAVVEETHLHQDKGLIKSVLLGLVVGSKHPVSTAIAEYLKTQNVKPFPIDGRKSVAGNGIEGLLNGKLVRLGNPSWLAVNAHPSVQKLLSTDLTICCLTMEGRLAVILGLEDTIRPEAYHTISRLQSRGVKVHLLSGDNDGAVRKVASQLGLSEPNIRSRCSPANKHMYVKNLLESPPAAPKSRPPVVMFVGDGTNDAIALTQATIGVHVSGGTEIAQSAADVVLVRPNLLGVLSIITVSKKAMHRVAFNFGWSFVYNIFAVLLGAGAFVHARIPPEYAGLGELVSVLPVIFATVLLRWESM